MKLLIVDRDPLIIESLKVILPSHNDITITGLVVNGMDAADICNSNKPDAILMDINADGVTAARIIKARYPDIKVIMLTVFDIDPKKQQAINAGADGFIVKADLISNFAENIRTLVFAK